MTRITTIPAQIMSVVRCAVLAELGDAAAEIEQSSIGCGMEDRPEDFSELLDEFDTVRALLEEVGWGHDKRAIDAAKHRRPLLAALDGRLGIDRYFVEDPSTSLTSRVPVEQDISGMESFLAAAGLRGVQ
jgi:hypothetical protein